MPHKAFITNQKTRSLKKRLEQLIEHSQELKFLVGFFYFSGWQQLFKSIQKQENLIIKVLVGLEVDRKLGKIFEIASTEESNSREDTADHFFASLSNALNNDLLDNESFYEQVDFFLELLESNRLIIKKTAEPNHAKLYLFKIKDELKDLTESRFITGSSNLTRAGILEQNEFNVEISDYGTDEAEKYFDELWSTAVEITENPDRKKYLLDLIKNKSQAATISPFEAYCLVLKTYIDLMEQKIVKPQVIRLLEKNGYKKYSYQLDAINQAVTVIENYNGVIIADVVGLGKSIISGLIAKHLSRRGMIICPPGLIGNNEAKSGWRKYKNDFELYDWEIWSSGNLEGASNYLSQYGDDVEVILIDEAHRFRNQDTENYEFLSNICRNRIAILLTATPFNNSPADIFSMLKLFIIPGKSSITLDNNLESRFSHYESTFRRLSFISKNYKSKNPKKRKKAESNYQTLFGDLPINLANVHERTKYLANEIRKVLEPVLIRRNRIDLKTDPVYSQEVTELSEMEENPRELFFELSKEQSKLYDEIVNEYFGEEGRFTGAIYQPFMYEKRKAIMSEKLDAEGNRAFQQQSNLFDFMRRLVVKRFESSFGAFQKSISNFERIHECVLKFIENSGGKYILDRKLVEKVFEADPEEIDIALEEFAKKLTEKKTPKNERIYIISDFDLEKEFIKDIKSDLKLMEEIKGRIKSLSLTENDPKLDNLLTEIQKILDEKSLPKEPIRKVVIFTEYVDTVKHVLPLLEKRFPEKVLYCDGGISAKKSDDLLYNFDASAEEKDQKDEFQILLTSDKLSEGINLNRAGAIINYDIPWNPTRVIQRVGRINRIGKKVFENLRIYNFFPTETGADIIKSRMIAGQKMFLIHNTLGEDAKIFDIDEQPTAADLYSRVNRNPEEEETESVLTKVRREYFEIRDNHPDIIARISDLPSRVKTAKAAEEDQLFVFRKKGLQFFIQSIFNTREDEIKVNSLSLEDVLDSIRCIPEEPRLKIGENFWRSYETIKSHLDKFPSAKTELSLDRKAQNNLQSALRFYKPELELHLPFIRMLIKDLRDFRTLSQYSIRRLASENLVQDNEKGLKKFLKEIQYLKGKLGENYLKNLESNLSFLETEIIIAIENVNRHYVINFNYDKDYSLIDEVLKNYYKAANEEEKYHFLPVSLYLSAEGITEEAGEEVFKATNDVFQSIGFSSYIKFKPELGSFREWIIEKLSKPETKEELKKRGKQLLQYAENSTLRKSAIENSSTAAMAIAKLIESFPQNSETIIDAGAFVVAQIMDNEGNPKIISKVFTPEEQKYLEENPQLRNNPEELLKALSNPDKKLITNKKD